VYKPCYLLITSFQVTFNPSCFAGTLTFSGFFHKSPCRLLVASTSNSLDNCPPKTRPLHEIAPTVGKGSFQRVDCNYQVDIWSRVTMATLRRVFSWRFRNPIPNHRSGCIEPCKWWDKLPTSTDAGFLNHQQYLMQVCLKRCESHNRWNPSVFFKADSTTYRNLNLEKATGFKKILQLFQLFQSSGGMVSIIWWQISLQRNLSGKGT